MSEKHKQVTEYNIFKTWHKMLSLPHLSHRIRGVMKGVWALPPPPTRAPSFVNLNSQSFIIKGTLSLQCLRKIIFYMSCRHRKCGFKVLNKSQDWDKISESASR